MVEVDLDGGRGRGRRFGKGDHDLGMVGEVELEAVRHALKEHKARNIPGTHYPQTPKLPHSQAADKT